MESTKTVYKGPRFAPDPIGKEGFFHRSLPHSGILSNRTVSVNQKEVVMSTRLFVIVVAGLLTLLFVGVAVGQPLPVRLYGGPMSERAYALVEGVDPGFCLAGWTRSFGAPGGSDILVTKTDPNGIPQWSRVSFGENDDEAYSMVRTTDQCYTITGWTRSFGPGVPNKNIFVLKLDQAGNQVWGWVYGGMQNDEAYSIVETMDGGYAVTGLTYSFGPAPQPNIFVLKLTAHGMLQWMRVYWMAPNHMEDEGYSIVQTADTGYAVVGRAKTISQAFFNPFVLKLDQRGNIQWLRTVPGEDADDEAYSVAVDLNGDILAGGWTRSFGTSPRNTADMFVSKFDLLGNILWSNSYGWPDGDEQVLDDRSLVGTSDHGSVLCGPTTSVGPGVPNPNFLILKLDPAGLPMWCRSHPSPYDPGLQSDVPLPMIEMRAGGYAVAGWTNSYPHLGGGDDFHLATLDPMGNRPVCVEPQEPEIESLPWIEWYVEDETCYPELDSIRLEPVVVKFDSICYDTTQTGIRNGAVHPGIPERSLELRTFGSRIELSLARTTIVEVQLFSSDGRQVARIARQQFSAGRHELALPCDIAAGAYLVCATGGGRSASTKVVKF